MNLKTIGILTGLFFIGSWIYNKFILAERTSISPYQISVDAGWMQTKVRIELLIKNNSNATATINKLAGQIIDDDLNVLASFKSNYSTKIERNKSTLLVVFGETSTINLLQLPNYKNFIVKGIASIDGFYIPFKFAVKDFVNA